MLWIFIFIGLAILSVVGIVVSNKCWHTDWADWLMLLSGIALVAAILFGGVSIAFRFVAKAEIVQFEETREVVIVSVGNGTNLENVGITQTVIDSNKWLTGAKASAKTLGLWSIYYGLGVEDMEYIKLGGD
jgi:hypothetical protein